MISTKFACKPSPPLRGPITKNQVAALLKDFEIRPVVVHPTKRADVSRHGYRAAQFEDAIARFLPPEPNIRTLERGGSEKNRQALAYVYLQIAGIVGGALDRRRPRASLRVSPLL